MATNKEAGIYRLWCEQTGETYIGATTDLATRRKAHFAKLRQGKHSCRPLQSSYGLHGEFTFGWEVVETIPIVAGGRTMAAVIASRELHWRRLLAESPGVVVVGHRAFYNFFVDYPGWTWQTDKAANLKRQPPTE